MNRRYQNSHQYEYRHCVLPCKTAGLQTHSMGQMSEVIYRGLSNVRASDHHCQEAIICDSPNVALKSHDA